MSTVFTTVAQTILSTSISTLISTSIDPYRLFEDGENGSYSDILKYADNYYVDAGVTSASVGDKIYQANDDSPNGNNWYQPTESSRPILREDSSGLYLEFDLVNSSMQVDLPADDYTVAIPTRKGLWVESVTHSGGPFVVGPTGFSGGATNILPWLSDALECRIVGTPLVINRALYSREVGSLARWYRVRGAGGGVWFYPSSWVLNGGAWSDSGYWIDILNWRDA